MEISRPSSHQPEREVASWDATYFTDVSPLHHILISRVCLSVADLRHASWPISSSSVAAGQRDFGSTHHRIGAAAHEAFGAIPL